MNLLNGNAAQRRRRHGHRDESRYQSPSFADSPAPRTGPRSRRAAAIVSAENRERRPAGKTVIVLDKANKKLWQARSPTVSPAVEVKCSSENPISARARCVEHGDTL